MIQLPIDLDVRAREVLAVSVSRPGAGLQAQNSGAPVNFGFNFPQRQHKLRLPNQRFRLFGRNERDVTIGETNRGFAVVAENRLFVLAFVE